MISHLTRTRTRTRTSLCGPLCGQHSCTIAVFLLPLLFMRYRQQLMRARRSGAWGSWRPSWPGGRSCGWPVVDETSGKGAGVWGVSTGVKLRGGAAAVGGHARASRPRRCSSRTPIPPASMHATAGRRVCAARAAPPPSSRGGADGCGWLRCGGWRKPSAAARIVASLAPSARVRAGGRAGAARCGGRRRGARRIWRARR